MPEIILKDVTKMYGKTAAVDHLSMVIPDHSFITLLGPSGCGKTTTLRMIAGLETPTYGEISIGGKVVFSAEKGIDIPPEKRGVGFLFQNYALWPHMTVYQNITFGLENLHWPKDKMEARARELMAMLRISEYRDRYPSELSGGQQQRVAIARTLSTGPSTLFMDEPLSNLDAKLRMEMRAELKRLHMETGATFIYVTHDQLEAMTLATRICLIKEGILQQYDAPLTVYNEPVNMFTADFIGSPSINLVPARAGQTVDGGDQLDFGGEPVRFVEAKRYTDAPVTDGKEYVVGIRPENIVIRPEGRFSGKVYSTLPSGMETVVKLHLHDQPLTSVIFGSVDFRVNEEVRFDIRTDKNLLFDKESGATVRMGAIKA
ncbi:MAG: ABC transporter ATP-binding protein [Succiniclasticum sp.]|jgi:multiple sugar transport system ATP-binding protein|nr:ABC transporter ATP-binding protein [Succiniclasticum sp.]MEE3479494.1 ABC transporter ATP-binding protein [Succiniclasticum sp.]